MYFKSKVTNHRIKRHLNYSGGNEIDFNMLVSFTFKHGTHFYSSGQLDLRGKSSYLWNMKCVCVCL